MLPFSFERDHRDQRDGKHHQDRIVSRSGGHFAALQKNHFDLDTVLEEESQSIGQHRQQACIAGSLKLPQLGQDSGV